MRSLSGHLSMVGQGAQHMASHLASICGNLFGQFAIFVLFGLFGMFARIGLSSSPRGSSSSTNWKRRSPRFSTPGARRPNSRPQLVELSTAQHHLIDYFLPGVRLTCCHYDHGLSDPAFLTAPPMILSCQVRLTLVDGYQLSLGRINGGLHVARVFWGLPYQSKACHHAQCGLDFIMDKTR